MFIGSYQPFDENRGKKSNTNGSLLENYFGFYPYFGFQVDYAPSVFFRSCIAVANCPDCFCLYEIPDEKAHSLDVVKWNKFLSVHIEDFNLKSDDDFWFEHHSEIISFIDSSVDHKYVECLFNPNDCEVKLKLPIIPFVTGDSAAYLNYSNVLPEHIKSFLIHLSNNVSSSFLDTLNGPMFSGFSLEKFEREKCLNAKETFERHLLVPFLQALSFVPFYSSSNGFDMWITNPLLFRDFTPYELVNRLTSNRPEYLQYKTYSYFDEVYAKFTMNVLPINVLSALKTVGVNDPCPCGSGKKFKKCHKVYLA